MTKIANFKTMHWLYTETINEDLELYKQMNSYAEQLKNSIVFSDDYFLDTLKKFKASTETSYLFLQNCPIGNLPDTPVESGHIKNKYINVPVKFLFGLFSLINIYPMSYIGENYGRLIRHVVPKKNREKQVGSHGSSVEFSFHIDNPDLVINNETDDKNRSICPEYLAFYCLRGDENALTQIILLDDIIENLTQQDMEVGLSNMFTVKRPDSFEDGNPLINNVPLFCKDEEDDWVCRYDYHNISSKDELGGSLLRKIDKITNEITPKESITFKSGDFLIIKNQKVLHKRTAFIPNYDGNERWLIRLFGMNEMPHASFINNPLVLNS